MLALKEMTVEYIFEIDEDDDFLPKDHPFFHPSNLDCIQELIKNSQKSDYSHLYLKFIKKIIPWAHLDKIG